MTAILAKPRGPGRPVDPRLHEERTTAILDAATRLFAQHGYPDTDVQWIGDALSLSKGTVYRYFRTKQELFFAAVDHGLDRLKAELDALDEADPLAKIEAAIRTFLAFFRANPEVVELLIQERAAFRDRSKEPAYFTRRRKDHGPWEKMVQDLVEAGRVRPVPVKRGMEVIGDLVFGTMFTDQVIGRKKPLREQARDVIDIAYNGILTQGERRKRAAARQGRSTKSEARNPKRIRSTQ